MNMLAPNAAEAYRKVELEARIEASSGNDLTVICLEEAVSALSQALLALERQPSVAPSDPITRAHGIVVYLARSVSPDNPLHDAMTQFYGGLAATLAANMRSASAKDIAAVKADLDDLLSAAKSV